MGGTLRLTHHSASPLTLGLGRLEDLIEPSWKTTLQGQRFNSIFTAYYPVHSRYSVNIMKFFWLGCLENTFEKFLIDYHGASQTVVSFVLGVAA